MPTQIDMISVVKEIQRTRVEEKAKYIFTAKFAITLEGRPGMLEDALSPDPIATLMALRVNSEQDAKLTSIL